MSKTNANAKGDSGALKEFNAFANPMNSPDNSPTVREAMMPTPPPETTHVAPISGINDIYVVL